MFIPKLLHLRLWRGKRLGLLDRWTLCLLPAEDLSSHHLPQADSAPLGQVIAQLLIHERLIDFCSRTFPQKGVRGSRLAHELQQLVDEQCFKIRTGFFQPLPIDSLLPCPPLGRQRRRGFPHLFYRHFSHFLEPSQMICHRGHRGHSPFFPNTCRKMETRKKTPYNLRDKLYSFCKFISLCSL
jgi:hypothetical protein